MEKTVTKFVGGLAVDASSWERRNHKRYGSLANICRQIDYDIKHGVTSDQVFSFLNRVRADSSFSTLRNNDGSLNRLGEIEEHFRGATLRR